MSPLIFDSDLLTFTVASTHRVGLTVRTGCGGTELPSVLLLTEFDKNKAAGGVTGARLGYGEEVRERMTRA